LLKALHQIQRSALLPYSTEKMMTLVKDVNNYASFLPWCDYAKIEQQHPTYMIATIGLAVGFVKQAFTTKNTFKTDGSEQLIEMDLEKGPFKHLHGVWRFIPLEANACKILLDIEFDFDNKIIESAIGPVFNKIAGTLLDSFCEQANEDRNSLR
jgi:ribosome-associated toxin RatA of RatAB toxin-antitoxin module